MAVAPVSGYLPHFGNSGSPQVVLHSYFELLIRWSTDIRESLKTSDFDEVLCAST
jgi:hypothetical protein